ncbi:multidrug effflux MFS transporter [Devosia sp. LjRoot3]|uniref:multidrug effflux MFS transporter n=1 Tax=Devosia sp. LjRoot3 TaxID=3342319 RepID=UPI003ECC50C6
MTDQSSTVSPAMSGRRTAIIGGLMVATGPLSLTLYAPALPSLVTDLGTTDAGGKLTLTVYFAAFALAQLICGPLSDRFGRRAIGIAFFAIYVLGGLVATFAPSLEVLLLGRVLQGFGVSAGVALSRAMVRDLFVGREAIGILTLINLVLTVAPAVAPTLGSVIMLVGTWHIMFVIMAGFGLAIIALLGFSARETLPEDRRVPLKPSTIIGNYGRLLRAPAFLLPAGTLAAAFGGFYASAALLPFVLIDQIGLTPFQFAMAMLIQTGSFITGNLIAARLSKHLDGWQLVAIGLVLIALAGLGYAVGPRLWPNEVLAVMIPVGFWMLSLACLSPSATAAAMSGFGEIAGSAGALTGFFQMGGGFLASLAGTLLFPEARTALVTLMPGLAALAIALALTDLWRLRRA